jgi:hypothetical protein
MRPRALLALAAACALSGCYHLGVEPIDDVGQVAVPMFTNATLRRDVEVALTRHVRREVLETTPLQLAREGGAARILRGAITSIREGVLIAGPAEEVLHSSVTVSVRFGVYDPDGALVVGDDADADGRPDGELVRTGYAEFTPAQGGTREAAIDEALRDLAEMIVFELTARSDDRFEPNETPDQATPLAPGRQVALVQRDPDWFKVTVPPGLVLHVTLFAPEAPVTLELRDAAAAPLGDATRSDDGRTASVAAGATERVVLLRITGDDRGRRYELLTRLGPAP